MLRYDVQKIAPKITKLSKNSEQILVRVVSDNIVTNRNTASSAELDFCK